MERGWEGSPGRLRERGRAAASPWPWLPELSFVEKEMEGRDGKKPHACLICSFACAFLELINFDAVIIYNKYSWDWEMHVLFLACACLYFIWFFLKLVVVGVFVK